MIQIQKRLRGSPLAKGWLLGGALLMLTALSHAQANQPYLVNRLYQGLMGRLPSTAEVQAALATPPAELAATLLQSDEYRQQVAPLLRLYAASLGLMPSDLRLQTLRQGDDPLRTLAAELLAAYPGTHDGDGDPDTPAEVVAAATFVEALYQRILLRPGEAGGVAYWQDQLAAGLAPEALLMIFSESGEHRLRRDRRIALDQLYGVFQNRLPSVGEQWLGLWVQSLKSAAAAAHSAIAPPLSPQPLKRFNSQAALREYLNSGQNNQVEPLLWDDVSAFETPTAVGGDSAVRFSTTNVQVAGVDELDRVKSDGQQLFVLSQPTLFWGGPAPFIAADAAIAPSPAEAAAEIRRYRLLQTAPTLLDSIELPSELQWQGLYLTEERLAALGSQGGGYYWGLPNYGGNAETALLLFSRSGDDTPQIASEMRFDGQLMSSRRIHQTLYLALRYSSYGNPWVAEANAETRLPRWSIDGADQGELIAADQCYYPAMAANGATSALTLLVALPLDGAVPIVQCVAGPIETLFATPTTLYLVTTKTHYPQPLDPAARVEYGYEPALDIHRFVLEASGPRYTSSGAVAGHLGWKQEYKPYRLGEYNGVLAVTTSLGSTWSGDPRTRLTLLQDNGQGILMPLATLPNPNRPAPIGKPGEELYGVRYIDDRAYLVTFQMIDPLYIIDLSNPLDPCIAGELEVEGYADYLIPVAADLLVGIGKDALPDPGGEFRGAWYQGVQLTLIDVADPAAPTLLDRLVLGRRGSESDLFQTPHALAFLPALGNQPARLALPVVLHDIPPVAASGAPWQHYGWSNSSLYLFEIDPAAPAPALELVGRIDDPTATAENSYADGQDRALLIDDHALFIQNDELIWQAWP